MTRSVFTSFGLGCAFMSLAACTTQAPVPAVMTEATPEAMETVRQTLATVVGRANVELGADDPTTGSTITVLPPPLGPYETASPARPQRFELMMEDGACYLVDPETATAYLLDSVACKPA